MNTSNYGLKLFTAISSVLAVILLVVYVVLLYLNQSTTPSEPVSYNMFFSQKTSDHTIRYYNGNHFLRLDTNTQESSLLTPKMRFPIPGVDDAVWTPHGVYFRFGIPPSVGSLSDYVDEVTYDSENDISQLYWYAGFDADNIELSFTTNPPSQTATIAYNDSVIYGMNDKLFELSRDGSIQQIYQSTSPNVATYPLSVTDSLLVVLLQGTRQLEIVKIDKKSNQSTTVASVNTENSLAANAYANSTDAYVLLKLSNTQHRLQHYSLAGGSQKLLLEPFTGNLFKDGQEIYATKNGQDEVVLFKLSGADSKRLYRFVDNTSDYRNIHCFDQKCYLVDSGGLTRVLSNDKNQISSLKLADSRAIEKVIDIEGTELSRNILSHQNNSYTMTIGMGDIVGPYTKLQDELRAKQINPFDYTFDIKQGRYEQP